MNICYTGRPAYALPDLEIRPVPVIAFAHPTNWNTEALLHGQIDIYVYLFAVIDSTSTWDEDLMVQGWQHIDSTSGCCNVHGWW